MKLNGANVVRLSFVSLVLGTSACTTLPRSIKPPPIIQGIGAVDIERSANFLRGPNVGSFASPVKYNNSDFFVGTLGGSFGRFDTRTGSFKWKKTYKVGVASRPVIEGKRVFIGAMDGFVYAYNLQNGDEYWRKKLSAESNGNMLFANGNVYVATADNVLWALNSETGQELWTLRRPSPAASYYWSLRGNTAGVMSPDGKIIYVGFSDGVVVALNAATGDTIWERSFSRPGRFQDADSEPLLSPDGTTLFVALPDHSIQILRTADGLSMDTFPEASGFLPLLDFKENTITYSTANGSVRKYQLSSKNLLWETFLDQKGMAGDIVKLKEGVGLFVSTRFGAHLIDLKKGTVIDEKYLGEGIIARPYTDGSKIFIITGRGRFEFLRVKI